VTFGDDLRAARTEAHLSQQALSDLVGINVNTISGYEVGRTHPQFENLDKLEGVLGVRFNVETGDPVTPKDVPEAEGFTSKDEAPKPRKAAAQKKAAPKSSGMPSLRLQLEMPYRLAGTALTTRMPYTAGMLQQQAGPCAEAWDTFLLRYPKLREKIEQGAVAADVVNLVMAHMPIIQTAREELAAIQMANQGFPTDNSQAA
jgi:transcriptional regulator with XRE-family HTH domain